MKFCPQELMGSLRITQGPFARAELEKKFLSHSNGVENLRVALVQHMWRWSKARAVFEEILFRLIYKNMDLKKEGFAIFKAHDKVSEEHVLAPRRTRSILQPMILPSSIDHYFPSSATIPLQKEHVIKMIHDIRKNVLIPYPAAWRVFNDAMQHLNTLSNVTRISSPLGARLVNGRWTQGGKIIVVGDLHGQLSDLLHILNENGFPDDGTYYVFNGDFVDRGPFGVEVLLILFSLMLVYPKQVVLNRGNHECDYMNEEYGFDVEVGTKYDRNIFRLMQRCFCALPLATIINSKIFVVHGGIPRRKGITLDDICRVQRFRQIPMPEHEQPEEDEIFQDMMWSDPSEVPGWQESERGAGVQWGPDVTKDFLELNGFDLIIRSHEEFVKGYEEHHNGKVVTVFSASNYDGPETNKGSFLVLVGQVTEPSFHTYQVQEDDFELTDADEDANRTMVWMGSAANFSFKQLALTGLRIRRSKDEVLRVLRERIYHRRHRLLAYFTKLDRTQKGTVWKIEWVEVLRNILNLDIPWFFLRRFVAEEDFPSRRINYSKFLSRFHNGLTGLWLEDWEQSMAQQLRSQIRARHRSHQVQAAFSKEAVNYNEFCSVMRAIDYSLSDSQLFQLFVYFDMECKGVINGKAFLAEMDVPDNAPTREVASLHWELDAVEQLQNIIIQGRSQLHSVFKITPRDRTFTEEKFLAGMKVVSRSMRKPLTLQQQHALYEYIAADRNEFTYDYFLHVFSVFDSSRPKDHVHDMTSSVTTVAT